MLSEDFDAPRVFFSYSYRDSEQLKPIFRKACVEAGVSPVFANLSGQLTGYAFTRHLPLNSLWMLAKTAADTATRRSPLPETVARAKRIYPQKLLK